MINVERLSFIKKKHYLNQCDGLQLSKGVYNSTSKTGTNRANSVLDMYQCSDKNKDQMETKIDIIGNKSPSFRLTTINYTTEHYYLYLATSFARLNNYFSTNFPSAFCLLAVGTSIV